MIDWLGARRPIEIVLLMTAISSLGLAAAEHAMLPPVASAPHAPA